MYNVKQKLETIIEDVEFSNHKESLITKMPEILQLTKKNEKKIKEDIQHLDIQTIYLPTLVNKHLSISLGFKKGKSLLYNGQQYYVNDDKIMTLIDQYSEEGPNNTTLYYLNFDGKIFPRDKVSVKTKYKSEVKEEIKFTISSENLLFLKNPPSLFEFNLIKKNYSVNNDQLIIKNEIILEKKLPLDIIFNEFEKYIFLNPDYFNKNGNHINNQILYNSFAEMLYGTYSINENELLQSFDVFNASKEAKVLSLKYNINLKNLKLKISGEIQKEHVIEEYNKLLPKILSTKDSIMKQLQYFILGEDEKGLKKIIPSALARRVSRSTPEFKIFS